MTYTAELTARAADNGRTVEQQAAYERLVGTAETVREQRAAGVIGKVAKRAALVAAGAAIAATAIACTAGTSTDNAIPALDVPAPVSESTWTDAPIERLPAPQVVVTTPPAVEVAPVESAPVEVPAPTCEERGLITAEDMTCVPPSFYEVPATPFREPVTLYPCETEDSEMCYWNAASMGNGEGRSFIRVFGETYYAD